MDRINTATKALDLFGPGKHGFKDGNLSLAIQPTALDAAFFNDLQEEAIGVIEGAGLVPAAGNRTQLRQAIDIMIARATGNDFKASVRAATTANIASLAGGAPNTIDGVALAANDRVLVKDQATASQNGIYVVTTLGTGANGTWMRAVDSDGAGELTSGAVVAVEEGTLYTDSQWMLTTDGAITIGTTSLTFVRKDFGSYASNAESQAFSLTGKAISPATLAQALKGSNQSLAASGYQKLPGGLIIQWGTGTTVSGGPTSVTFPIAFPNTTLTAALTITSGSPSTQNAVLLSTSFSNTSLTAYSSAGTNVGFAFIAIGY